MKTLREDQELLGVYLYCMQKGKLENWAYAASASFKLLTFDGNRTELEEHMNAFVFDQLETGFGKTSLIAWNDLFKVEKNYVKNDTVNLELKIDVADPFAENKSQLMFIRH